MNQENGIDFLISTLNQSGWQPIKTDENCFLIPVEGNYGSFFVSLYFNSHNKMLAARGNIPVYVSEEKVPIILHLINCRNYKIPLGNLEYDIGSQQVFFRAGLFFENMDLDAQLLHNIIHEVCQSVQHFQPIIQAELGIEKM